jgi:hypothetical protein
MSSVTMHRRWTSSTFRQPTVVRHFVVWVDVINAAAAVLRPMLVSAGIITAAATWSPPAHADPLADSITDTVNKFGISSDHPVSTSIPSASTPWLPSSRQGNRQ